MLPENLDKVNAGIQEGYQMKDTNQYKRRSELKMKASEPAIIETTLKPVFRFLVNCTMDTITNAIATGISTQLPTKLSKAGRNKATPRLKS